MKISALFTLTALGFLVFLVLFIRVGFFIHIPINHLTLITAFVAYIWTLSLYFSLGRLAAQLQSRCYKALALFVVFFVATVLLSLASGLTYDTSWDGQGYNQTAIIAFANGWNPVYQPAIQLHQKLVSQVFAEGYPSALWEVQASFFTLTNKMNTAKVVNVYIAVISAVVSYSFLRKLRISQLLSSVLTVLLVAHPVYLIQLLTFMQDGFGYQVILISVVSLLLYISDHKAIWALVVFMMSLVLLVSTKYSFVPVALGLSVIGFWIVLNNLMNKRYTITAPIKATLGAAFVVCLVFAYLPYVRNTVVFGYPFYPTNIPDLMGSVKFTNIPKNLNSDNKAVLFFYGIFSKSQAADSGDPNSESNTAELKVPFTFTHAEVTESGGIFNNRVGGLGPLFSGAVVTALLILLVATFTAQDKADRYTVYAALAAVFVVIVFSLLTPAPNLHRYVTYLYLLPFVVIIPLLHQRKIIKYATYFTVLLLTCNAVLSFYAVYIYNLDTQTELHDELTRLSSSGKTYKVSAQNFYSNYNLLAENGVSFVITDHLECSGEKQTLSSSSTTTSYCEL